MGTVYQAVRAFKRKYPNTVAWRIKSHSNVIQKHLNPDEEVIYGFAAQKSEVYTEFIRTYAVALTNKRLLLGQKRLFFGYFFLSITPDLFNDLTVDSGLLWGKIIVDTVKENVTLSNIQKQALPEIETAITEFMMKAKERYMKTATEE